VRTPLTRGHPASTLLPLLALLSCGRPSACPQCDTVVIAATGEPTEILPPLAYETVARDIGDQVYERLADLAPGKPPIEPSAFTPRLAERWEQLDSVTWRFTLRPDARWQDGTRLTTDDVLYSFAVYRDTTLGTSAAGPLAGTSMEAEGPDRFVIRFDRPYPEQLYDATYHVRIIPKHIWSSVPREKWSGDTVLGHFVGSGPYHLARWEHGQSLTLLADTTGAPRPALRRAVWRFAPDPDAALNLVLSHEADLLEAIGTPDRIARVGADSSLRTITYPSAAYGFLGYRVAATPTRRTPHPALSQARVRRALNEAVNRAELAVALFGPGTKAPPGPMSQLLWIWDDSIQVLPFDTVAAAGELDQAGWARSGTGVRTRSGRRLTFDILVPSTSSARRRLAEALQERWRRLGIETTITAVDFPVFQERLGRGDFDAYIGAWLDEPSPRGLADQWTTAGRGALNFGGYSNPAFDRAFAAAVGEENPASARRLWRVAMDTLNADAPALFLYAPANVAAVSRGLEGIQIDPYSWLSELRTWRAVR